MFHLFSLVLLIEYFSLKIARTAEKLLWECRNLCITETSVMPNSVNNECNDFICFSWYPLHSKHSRIFTQIDIYLILTLEGPCPVHVPSSQSWDAFQNQSSSDMWLQNKKRGQFYTKHKFSPWSTSLPELTVGLRNNSFSHILIWHIEPEKTWLKNHQAQPPMLHGPSHHWKHF